MINRIRGVLSLDSDVFNEIEHDPSATFQALLVVIVTSLLAAAGGANRAGQGGIDEVVFGIGMGTTSNSAFQFLAIAGWAIVAWLLWSLITYVIGTKIFSGEATIAEMMRVIGFAYAPLALQVFSFIPILGTFIVWGAALWSIAAVFVAIKEGLDVGTRDAVITAGVGWVVYLIGMGVILNFF